MKDHFSTDNLSSTFCSFCLSLIPGMSDVNPKLPFPVQPLVQCLCLKHGLFQPCQFHTPNTNMRLSTFSLLSYMIVQYTVILIFLVTVPLFLSLFLSFLSSNLKSSNPPPPPSLRMSLCQRHQDGNCLWSQ